MRRTPRSFCTLSSNLLPIPSCSRGIHAVGGGHGAEGAAGGGGGVDTTSKWKAIIKQASVTTGKGNKGAQ